MVRLRFQREGKPGQAHYRLVAVDRREKRDGRPVETIGFYNPRLEKDKLTVKEDRVKYWREKGAQPSETVKNLLKESGVWKRTVPVH
jgi:small subunit ribosomal protein S16